MFFLKNPPERALVMSEHQSDTVVGHLIAIELLTKEIILLADFVFRSHWEPFGMFGCQR